MPFLSRSSLVTANGSREDVDVALPMANIQGKQTSEKRSDSATIVPISSTTLGGGLPTPATQGAAGSVRKGKQKKSARVSGGLKVHWAQLKRRIGTGTAPSTSSALEPDESGDSCSNGRMRQEAQNEQEEDGVDEVIVDREWSDEIKSSSITHSEHGGSPEKSSNQMAGTNTDKDSFLVPSDGLWTSSVLLIFLRWRIWPAIHHFFVNHFLDEKSEMHYMKENWFLGKNLALWSSAFLVINWALAIGFIQHPVTLPDEIFYYGVSPALTFPVIVYVMFDFPRDRPCFYQLWLVFATWQWAIYQTSFMYWCEYYTPQAHCGTKDFLTLFYYTSSMQTVGLFGLKLHRFPAMLVACIFFCISCGFILPRHPEFSRNLINFISFQAFILYIHYMRENAERRLYTLRDQLKVQFRATQKAQVNERKAADSKRRLTSYVRVPLNTALLAVQNMDAHGSVPKSQEIEFKALEGSLSMMSKVLNDVLDFNRMDSGRFESVHKPYSFHQVMSSMFVPLRLATNARELTFDTDLDKRIDEVARRALYEALGESGAIIDKRLAEDSEEDGIVVGDETRLRQIITNLASNACKFTPAGGKLTISTKLILPRLPSIDNAEMSDSGGEAASQCRPISRGSTRRLSQHDGTQEMLNASVASSADHTDLEQNLTIFPHRLSATHLTQHNTIHSTPPPLEWIVVRIEVTDTGYGIRPKDMVQSKLFTAFNQTEQGRLQGGKGTGLGLALVRQIVKLSGGRLGVQSKVGQGSTFWVELPLGVGMKATPALVVPPEHRDFALDTPSSLTRTKTSSTNKFDLLSEGFDLPASPQVGPPRPQSALQSIMEQGGLVEISTKRGERSPVLTRTIGDPSTGTHAMPDDIPPHAIREPLPPLLTNNSSSTTIRPRLSQLPKPRTFTIEPPISPADSAATSSTQNCTSGSSAQDGPLRVLVVDDDPLTRKLMSRMLTRIGCKVATAENGEMALEMILGQRATPSSEDTGSAGLSLDCAVAAAAASEEYRYAVIFLDNQMPVLSGLDTVAKLREMGRQDFVVGVTGNALLTDQQEYLEAGADHVLTKPVLEKSLKSMLAIADERRKQGPPAAEPPGPAPTS